MLAVALSSPEAAISRVEAQALTEAGVGVAKWYVPINPVVGPAGAWISLAGVVGLIYGPKLINGIKRRRGIPVAPPQAPAAPPASEDRFVRSSGDEAAQ